MKRFVASLLAVGIFALLLGQAQAQVNVEFEGELYHTWEALKQAAIQNSPDGDPTMHCGQVITDDVFKRGAFNSEIDRFRCYRSAADFLKFEAATDAKLAALRKGGKAEAVEEESEDRFYYFVGIISSVAESCHFA